MSEALNLFFISYLSAWQQLDGSAIAQHYTATATIADGDGIASYTQTEMIKKFEANCQQFQAMGFQRASYSVSQVIAGSNTVDLLWHVQLAEKQFEFGTSYALVSIDGEWRIMSASAYPLP